MPAAGRGVRLGGERKQLRRLGGAPVVVQTLRAFERCAAAGPLIVAGPPAETDAFRDRLKEAGISDLYAVVEGGSSRQASVQRALEAAPEEAEVVLIHDAVRPFVEGRHIRNVVEAAHAHGAAALAVPASDTLRRGRGGQFAETIDRQGCFLMQTPQGFRRQLLEEAFAHADFTAPATDDVALVQAAGYDVRIVKGDRRNFKITTPADWQLAQALWPLWEKDLKAHADRGTSYPGAAENGGGGSKGKAQRPT